MAQKQTQSQVQARKPPGGSGVLLAMPLDGNVGISLQDQIYSRMRDMILSGSLHPSQRLPATRVLARELSVSRNTILQVYDRLMSEGYITSQVGSGSRVSENLPDISVNWQTSSIKPGEQMEICLSQRAEAVLALQTAGAPWIPSFSPGMPAIGEFPFEAWSKLLYEEWRAPGLGALQSDAGGFWPLRESIAQYVRTSRGVQCDSDQVLIVSGNREGTELAARVLMDDGDMAIVEDPGFLGVRSALASAGVKSIPLRVDQEGFDFAHATKLHRRAKALCVAPSHHYPLGGTTTLPRRLALLDWARQNKTWIIEDDYDSEFRYSDRPLPSLQSLDPAANIIYIGSFSKVLFPSLRLGYVVVPKPLVQPFTKMKLASSGPTSMIAQRVTNRFLETEMFYRHLRVMRKTYNLRRSALVRALRDAIPDLAIPTQQEAGLFLATRFEKTLSLVDDRAVAQAALAMGIHVEPLSSHYLSEPKTSGLVLGFGGLGEKQFAEPVARLAKVIAVQVDAMQKRI